MGSECLYPFLGFTVKSFRESCKESTKLCLLKQLSSPLFGIRCFYSKIHTVRANLDTGLSNCLLCQQSSTGNNSAIKYSAISLLSAILIQAYLFMLLLLYLRDKKAKKKTTTKNKGSIRICALLRILPISNSRLVR